MYNIRFNSFYIFFGLLISIASLANTANDYKEIPDRAGFEKKLKEKAKITKTIYSDFRQEKYLSFLSENVQSTGSFMLKAPGKLRWEYNKPFKYLIVMNSEKIMIKDDESENKFDINSNKMFMEINSILIGAVTGTLLNDNSRFRGKYYESKSDYMVSLVPVSEVVSKYLKSINIYFNKKDMTVTKLRMTEPSDDYTDIVFFNIKINQNISDEKFTIN